VVGAYIYRLRHTPVLFILRCGSDVTGLCWSSPRVCRHVLRSGSYVTVVS